MNNIIDYDERDRLAKIERDKRKMQAFDEDLERLTNDMLNAIKDPMDNKGNLVREIAEKIAENKFARNSIVHHVQTLDRFKHKFRNSIKDIKSELDAGKNCIYIVITDNCMICDDTALYASFLSHCGQFEAFNVNRFNVIHYQIVPNKNPQKLVLCCDNDNPNTIKEIDAQIKKCFNVECEWTYNIKWNAQQITIDLVMNSFSENELHYMNLYTQMQNNNIGSRINIKKPPVIEDPEINLKYVLFQLLQNNLEAKPAESVFVYNPTINIVNNVTINNITNNYNKNDVVDKLAVHKTWIDENPPYDRQTTSEYYKMYTNMVKGKFDAISIQKFAPLVVSRGYTQLRDGSKRVWIKNMVVKAPKQK